MGNSFEDDLKNFQKDFKNCIKENLVFKPEGPRSNLEVINELGKLSFDPNSVISIEKQKQSYNQQYWFRLFGIYFEGFPLLHKYLGQEKFFKSVQEYLYEYPESEAVFDKVGEKFADHYFVNTADKLGRDMISIDLMHNEMHQQLNIEEVASNTSNELSAITFKSELFLIQTDYNIPELRDELLKNFKKDEIVCKVQYWAYTKKGNAPFRTELNERAFNLMISIQLVDSLEQGIENFAETLNDTDLKFLEENLMSWVRFWQEKNWLTNKL